MFQRSDKYWNAAFAHGSRLMVAPVSSSANDEYPDIVAEYLDDDDIAEISGLNTSKKDSFEMASVKIELLDHDYEKHTDIIDLDEKNAETNKYQDFWKMIYEDEPTYFEPKKPAKYLNTDSPQNCIMLKNTAKGTNMDSPNDRNTAKEIQTVKKQIKRLDSSRIIKKVNPPKIIRDEKLRCLLCDEIFPNRTSLNRHTEPIHNVVQCIRCPFTATTRLVILQMPVCPIIYYIV